MSRSGTGWVEDDYYVQQHQFQQRRGSMPLAAHSMPLPSVAFPARSSTHSRPAAPRAHGSAQLTQLAALAASKRAWAQQLPQQLQHSASFTADHFAAQSIASSEYVTDMDVTILENPYGMAAVGPAAEPMNRCIGQSPVPPMIPLTGPLMRNGSCASSSSGCSASTANPASPYMGTSTSPLVQPVQQHGSVSFPAQHQQQFQPRLAPLQQILSVDHQHQATWRSSTVSCPLPHFMNAPIAAASHSNKTVVQDQHLEQEHEAMTAAALQLIDSKLQELMVTEMQLTQLLQGAAGGDAHTAAGAPAADAYYAGYSSHTLAPIMEVGSTSSSGNSNNRFQQRGTSGMDPMELTPLEQYAQGCPGHQAIDTYVTQHTKQQEQHQLCMAAVSAAGAQCGLSHGAKLKLQQLLAAQQLQMELQAELLALLPVGSQM